MGEKRKSMEYLLTIFMCSAVQNTCLPPYTFQEIFPDSYTCMTAGYQKALDKTIEIGKDEVNKHKIYIKFRCDLGSENQLKGQPL
tara:strand:- start:420 stop:674 length:255 start_codon:yes stop_codon:yes gene_type:complete